MHLLSSCCVVQVGECVLNDLGTVVVVIVVVVVVVGCMLIYTIEFILYSYASLGAYCPGMFIIQLLRGYALEC